MNDHMPPPKRFANVADNLEPDKDYCHWYEEKSEAIEQIAASESKQLEIINNINQEPEDNSNINFLEEDTEWVSKWFD